MPRCDLPGVRRRRQWSPDARALGMIGDRWVLLIARELAFGSLRLSELQRAFPGMSTGALEQRLNRMAAGGLVTRHRYAEVPPRVEFELTDAGRDLLAILAPIVQWALRWAWTSPQPDEWVDVTAMFRLAGCVVEPRGRHRGGDRADRRGRSGGRARPLHAAARRRRGDRRAPAGGPRRRDHEGHERRVGARTRSRAHARRPAHQRRRASRRHLPRELPDVGGDALTSRPPRRGGCSV